MKKLLAMLLVLSMAISVTACGGKSEEKAEAPSEALEETPGEEVEEEAEAEAPAEGAEYVVGICQLVQHDALDAATQGFMDALKEELGDQVTFDEQNASGDTEYGVALNISDFDGTVGGNISGTSDLAPLDQQAQIVKELFPDAKNVGLVYCSAEANSQYQVDTVQGYLEELGYTCKQYSFADSNDLSSVTQTAVDESDVLYIPTDNTAANNTEVIRNVCEPAKIPVVVGEEGICAGCGVATLSISYYDLGVATGKMAAKILTGESDISTMPIEYAPQFTKKYNAELCESLGVTIPDGYEAIQ